MHPTLGRTLRLGLVWAALSPFLCGANCRNGPEDQTQSLDPTRLEVVGIRGDGSLWHTTVTQTAPGTWTPATWDALPTSSGGRTARFVAVDCASAAGLLFVEGVTDDGELLQCSHNGTRWAPFENIGSRLRPAGANQFREVGLTVWGGQLALFATVLEAGQVRLLYAVSSTLNFFPPNRFIEIPTVDTSGTQLALQYQVDAVGAADGVHLVGVSNGRRLFTAVGAPPQPEHELAWPPFTAIAAPTGTGGAPLPVGPVGIASIGTSIHLVAQAVQSPLGGNVFHRPPGATSFVAVPSTPQGLVTTHLSCVGIGPELHLCSVSGGAISHTRLTSAGTWTTLAAVTDTAPDPASPFVNVAVTSRRP